MRDACLWLLPLALSLLALLCAAGKAEADDTRLVTYPAPAGETPSPDYQVAVNGRSVHVYTVDTLRGGPASFAYFDFEGEVTVTVTSSSRPLTSAAILPTSFDLTPALDGNKLTFTLTRPLNLTIEINGSWDRPLHLFANPIETDVPDPKDPHVIYYGPGIHEIGTVHLPSGTTVYIAGGAIVRGHILPGEKPVVEKDWCGQKVYTNQFVANKADHITIRGRGILDLGPLSWHARTAFVFRHCSDVLVEGITILDAPAWVVAIFSSRNVIVRDVKEICRRENSDGVDICNSQNVLVEDCFLRNNDDEVCVKTTAPPPEPESKHIVVRRCVIWNERARGLGITSETRADISDVLFRNCDIIHDFSAGGDCCSLAILVSDSGTMSDLRFEDIRVEHCAHTLINCWIGSDMWGHDKTRGHIRDVLFRNITVTGGGEPVSRLTGYDAGHAIDGVTFENLRINGKVATSLADARITANDFARDLKVTAGD